MKLEHGAAAFSAQGGELSIVVLAAGQGRRFGTAKQTALLGSKPLLWHTLKLAEDVSAALDCGVFRYESHSMQKSSFSAVTLGWRIRKKLVLGAHREVVQQCFSEWSAAAEQKAIQMGNPFKSWELISNHSWQTGLSSSVKSAISPGAWHFFLLADQPFVSLRSCLQILHGGLCGPKGMPAAAMYPVCEDESASFRFGVPALFPPLLVPNLRSLQGDQGAAKVLNSRDVVSDANLEVFGVDLGNELTDVDYPHELQEAQCRI